MISRGKRRRIVYRDFFFIFVFFFFFYVDVTLFDQTRGRRQACIQWMSIAEQTDETKGLDRRFDELDLDLVVEEDFFFFEDQNF